MGEEPQSTDSWEGRKDEVEVKNGLDGECGDGAKLGGRDAVAN